MAVLDAGGAVVATQAAVGAYTLLAAGSTPLVIGFANGTTRGSTEGGLALCIELLAGVLSGGAVLGQVESKKLAKNWGHTFIAIQPDALVDDFPTKAAAVLGAVKASGPNIRLPGASSAKIAAERAAAGTMPIPTQIWESICRTAAEGLPK